MSRLSGSETALRQTQEEMVRRLSAAAEHRDGAIGRHIEQVALYCDLIARRLGLDETFAELARRHGDYAMVGLAAHGVRQDKVLSALRLVFFAVGTGPVLAARAAKHGLPLRDRLVAYLPRYGAAASALAPLAMVSAEVAGTGSPRSSDSG